ncbi:MAG: fumarate reductase subunit FrdD [Fidelibacterota bacterium]
MTRSSEPIWWMLFSAGGMVSALLFPVLIVLTGFVLPFHKVDEDPLFLETLYTLLSHPPIQVILFAVISLPLFHWAHRFRYALIDMGLRKVRTPVSVFCYGSALVGTAITAVILWQF